MVEASPVVMRGSLVLLVLAPAVMQLANCFKGIANPRNPNDSRGVAISVKSRFPHKHRFLSNLMRIPTDIGAGGLRGGHSVIWVTRSYGAVPKRLDRRNRNNGTAEIGVCAPFCIHMPWISHESQRPIG